MTHAIKGGWVGQTFALATSNDSGGRKARIRRSKEQRKAMVESFIKKYQNSNDGNFPSLNLTHKEVGGSFYTVREIVREIIQENRVLGPAKLSLEEQNNDNLLEHYPLGSISIDVQACLSQSDETDNISAVASNQNQGSSKKLVENFNGQSHGPKQQILDSEQVVNGSIQAVKDDIGSDEAVEAAVCPHEVTSDEQLPNLSGQFPGLNGPKFENEVIDKDIQATDEEEYDEPILSIPVSIPHQNITQEHHMEISEEQGLHSVRDFAGNGHLRLESEQTVSGFGVEEKDIPASEVVAGEDNLDVEKDGSKLLESSNAGINGMKAEIVVEKFPLRPVAKRFDSLEGISEERSKKSRTLEVNGTEQDRVHVLENSSSLMNMEVGADLAGPSLKTESEPVDKTASLNVGNPSLEKLNCSTTKEVLALDVNDVSEIGAKVSSPVEAKPLNAPTVVTENLHVKSSVSQEQSIQEETAGIEDKLTVECNSSSKKGNNSKLDRINLESWEGTSEKAAGSETNPLLAFVKAFVTAFVKFWTE
ncbi:hypothetical protein ACH5RR_016363 [Cinchona calisaya]|uniref:AT3G52170-like helix-turn-helix domain-containing protein n=1 Tax=Cinchona calisaya TaxID=153742 RepID=A0ABD2ZVS6_9GENT